MRAPRVYRRSWWWFLFVTTPAWGHLVAWCLNSRVRRHQGYESLVYGVVLLVAAALYAWVRRVGLQQEQQRDGILGRDH